MNLQQQLTELWKQIDQYDLWNLDLMQEVKVKSLIVRIEAIQKLLIRQS